MTARPDGVDLDLLGPARAWHDGREVDLGSARHTAVLAVLALHAGRSVSREQLLTAVWGDDPPASALGILYTCVSALRHLLEPDRGRWRCGRLLTSGGGGYRLNITAQRVDALRFEALREQGRRYRAAGQGAAELAALESALGLWHGDALAGVPGPYAEAQRRRLGELRLATAERRAALLVELGRPDDAVAALRPLAAAHPHRESLRALLAAALAAAGRPEATAAPRAAAGTPFLGRAAELRRLRSAVADVAAGRGGALWVTGTYGAGKTALLHAALADVPPGCRIGWGVADDLARRTPLGTLLECLESALAGEPGREQVRKLFDAARETLGGRPAEAVSRAVGVVRAAAAGGPLILVADQIEGADDVTLATWVALHRLTADAPLLLIAAGAPDTADGRLAGMHAAGPERVRLAGLRPADAAALVRALATEPPEPEELHRILRAAGGNPYHLRHLALAGTAAPSAGVVAAVTAHLDRFTDETRQALRAVAFLGAGCTVGEVAAVTERSPAELDGALAPARAAGVLDGPGEPLRFRHPIAGLVLRDGTPAALRRMVHRSFAEQLAATGAPPERVAAQLLAGPVPLDGWAGRWLVTHVEELGRRAPDTAVAVLQLARGQDTTAGDDRLVLAAWLARLLFRAGQDADAEAGWVAARTTDPDLEAEMRFIVAAARGRRGDHDAAADTVRAVLSERRLPQPWLDRFRALLAGLRPHLPGEPTAARMSRSALLDGSVRVGR